MSAVAGRGLQAAGVAAGVLGAAVTAGRETRLLSSYPIHMFVVAAGRRFYLV